MAVIPWFGRTFCARKKLNKEHFPVNFYDFGPTYLIFSSKNINKHITPFGVGEWKTIGSSLLAKPKEVYPLPSSPIRPYSSPRQEQAPQRFIHSPWQNFRISVDSLKKSCMGTCNIHCGVRVISIGGRGRYRKNDGDGCAWIYLPPSIESLSPTEKTLALTPFIFFYPLCQSSNSFIPHTLDPLLKIIFHNRNQF